MEIQIAGYCRIWYFRPDSFTVPTEVLLLAVWVSYFLGQGDLVSKDLSEMNANRHENESMIDLKLAMWFLSPGPDFFRSKKWLQSSE